MEETSPLLNDGKRPPKATIGDLIGGGGFGLIYSGTWDDGKSIIEAAFKSISEQDDFEKEKQFLKNNQMNHIFMVKYFGTTTKDSFE